MSGRDDELEALLKPLRQLAPDASQRQRWQQAVQDSARPLSARAPRPRLVLQLVAATLLGVLLGGTLMKVLGNSESEFAVIANNSSGNATFEYSRTNLD